MLTIVVAAVLGIIICFYFITAPFKYWKNRNIPHPPISYLFGNVGPVVQLKKSLGEAFTDIYNQYPSLPYVGVYKIRTPCVLVRDLDLVKDVFVKNFSSFEDNDVIVEEETDPLFARNPFAAKGERWRETRSQIAPLYTPKRIKEVFPLIDAVCKNMIKYIHSEIIGKTNGIDAKALSEKYTTDVVASCALGLEGNSFLNPKSEYIRMWKKILSPSFFLNLKIMFLFIFPELSRIVKAKFIPDDVTNYYRRVVNETLKYRSENNIYRGDFLDALSELKKKVGDSFTNEDVTAHVVGFFVDGTETSAIVLSFVLYELGLHPDIQSQLKSEIDNVLQKSNGKVTYEAIQEMEYLDQIVNESLRKNATGFILSRVCTKRICLEPPNNEIPKITIEPGTAVIIPILGIHHDPKYYPDPLSYDPTRFTNENKEKRHRYSFLPFGEGPRACLGQRFGITQVKIAIVNIVKHFEITINKKTVVPYTPDPQYFLLAAKDGIFLDFQKRF